MQYLLQTRANSITAIEIKKDPKLEELMCNTCGLLASALMPELGIYRTLILNDLVAIAQDVKR